VSKRVTPSERLRAEVDEVFAGGADLASAIEQVARIGARLLLQTALEAEATAFLGRERYARAETSPQAREGSRNGYGETTIKTTSGPVTLSRPKLRGTTEAFASRLLGTGVTKTHALESLVIAGFVRGLSTRDVEATLAEALGEAATVSRSTVSRICEQIHDEMQSWQQRRLEGLELDYLFLDASFFRYHVGAAAEPVFAAWGITTAGRLFVGLDTSTAESTDAWSGFLTDLGARGLRCPLLVISDGAAGLISAVEQTMPAALRQRCLIHRARNLVAKIPKNAQAEVKADYWAIFEVPEHIEPGLEAVAYVQANIDAFATRWRDAYPAAVRVLLADRESLTHYLRTPREHWNRVRHSNFIERTFGETRRRAKVIGRLPGETSCVSLVWAVLDRASRGARGFTMTPAGLRRLQDLRRTLLEPPTPLRHTEPAGAEVPDAVGAVA